MLFDYYSTLGDEFFFVLDSISLWKTSILEVINLLKDTNLEMGVIVNTSPPPKKIK
jgi:hypothetical protein